MRIYILEILLLAPILLSCPSRSISSSSPYPASPLTPTHTPTLSKTHQHTPKPTCLPTQSRSTNGPQRPLPSPAATVRVATAAPPPRARPLHQASTATWSPVRSPQPHLPNIILTTPLQQTTRPVSTSHPMARQDPSSSTKIPASTTAVHQVLLTAKGDLHHVSSL